MSDVGSGRAERDEWLATSVGVSVRSNGLDRAARRVRYAIAPWVLVDEGELGLETALAVFPGKGRRRPDLLGRLAATGVVRQLIVTRGRRDVLALLLFAPSERAEVFLVLEAMGEDFMWDDVLEEDRAVEAQAWLGMAKRAAAREGLLSPPERRKEGGSA